jgi:hypothetical protein
VLGLYSVAQAAGLAQTAIANRSSSTMTYRGPLVALLLAMALGLAVPALCDKPVASDPAIAVDYQAFEKALDGLKPVRQLTMLLCNS